MSRSSSIIGRKRKAPASSLFIGTLVTSFLITVPLGLFLLRRSDARVGAKSSSLIVAAAEAAAEVEPENDGSAKTYDPLKCNDMHNGHCRDEEGGAWSYRKADGTCTHSEQRVPKDPTAAKALPSIFPDVRDGVLDFGGGVGAYMTSFRDAGVKDLVVIEPHALGDCLFRGLTQQTTDLVNTPLDELPKLQYDLVMTIEVCEHLPVDYHPHIIGALTQASRKYLLFSAAHPGQPGEGHVGPSMKWRDEWIKEISEQTDGEWELDQKKTDALWKASMFRLLKDNAFIMKKRSGKTLSEASGVDPADTVSAKRELR
jgi:hypothetical protein